MIETVDFDLVKKFLELAPSEQRKVAEAGAIADRLKPDGEVLSIEYQGVQVKARKYRFFDGRSVQIRQAIGEDDIEADEMRLTGETARAYYGLSQVVQIDGQRMNFDQFKKLPSLDLKALQAAEQTLFFLLGTGSENTSISSNSEGSNGTAS